jgi:hypothetical protein
MTFEVLADVLKRFGLLVGILILGLVAINHEIRRRRRRRP